jgi:TetR/AcrR family transcriptional repressor of bet genes
MPRRVDHEQRRRQITDAVVRIAVRGGLPAATFREVAAEAGVSVRSIQYYFGAKDELLLITQRHVAERATARLLRFVRRAGDSPREVLRAALTSFIPTDRESREAMLMFLALHTASLLDPTLARVEAGDVPRALQELVERQLTRGRLRAGVDARYEAALLAAAVPSLASAVLDGTTTAAAAVRTIEYAIDRAISSR